MSAPRFSVIIPAYNSTQTLARAIDSVLAQTWPAHEIIVVDDASSDGTGEVAKAYGTQIRYLRREHNAGVSAARNYGVEQATGDWLAFLDADDWYFADRLKLHAEWIVEDPQLDFLTGDYEYRNEKGEFLSLSMGQHASGRAMIEKAKGTQRAVMERNEFEAYVADHFGDTHTLSVPRQEFLELGGYPQGFKVCEDVHFLARLVAASKRAGVICKPLGVYLIHGGSATRRDLVTAQRENVRTLTDLQDLAQTFPEAVRLGVKQRLQTARYNLACALIRNKHRSAAVRAVLPSLVSNPGWSSVRDVLSILKG